MELLYLLIGIILGAITAWFFAKQKFSSAAPVSKEEFEKAEKQISELNTETTRLTEQKSHLENSLQRVETELETERKKKEELTRQLAQAETENKNLLQRLTESKKELEELNTKLTAEFKNIANAVLEEKTKSFTEHNQKNLETVLSPLKDKLDEFKKQVQETYANESRETFSLKEEVRKLQDLNFKIQEEASNLTKALKGDTKKQGTWGELILERILERSGLEKDREYKVQVSTSNADGEIIRPDFIVYLPDDKHLIIDSKVSLTAYEAFVGAETDELREKFKKEHIASIRNHIKLLGAKNYQTAETLNSPELVLMFIPIESSFGVAVQEDQELFNDAWDKKIVIVTPSTLLATLRTIASIWKQEKQTRNALEIAKQGGNLYDKFTGFVNDLLEVGKKMDSAKSSYADAMKKLSEGNGNLIKSVENLKNLGAKAAKSLPKNLIERANEP
ncbi:MAG: DNA recombination protein RmuC [Bacteroidetes bacterium]|nr:DNA recombination protein RmuC [Bacteroidota bacterium]